MKRARVIAIAGAATAAAVLAVVAAVSVGLTAAPGEPDAAERRSTIAPTSEPSPTPEPTASPVTSDAPDEPPVAGIDPYYGDAVAAVADGDAADLASGLRVELVSVSPTTVTGSGIGSTSGDAIIVEVRISNAGSKAEPVAVAVNAYAGAQRVPLTPAGEDDAAAASVSAGGTTTGRYTFATDGTDDAIWITVSTSPSSGLVVFEHRQ